jgi:hypothetical protein
MEYTTEQRKLVEAARAEGRWRVMLEYTPEQLADWEAARDQAIAEKPEIIARFHKMRAAESEETFSGHLRRAIGAEMVKRRNPRSISEEACIDWRLLEDFRCGDAILPSDVIDRLVAVLGLRLMQEIRDPAEERSRKRRTESAEDPDPHEVTEAAV